MKFKFDYNKKSFVLTMKQLLAKHDDLTRLKNPRIFLGMKDSRDEDLYSGDTVRVKIQQEKYEHRTLVQKEKWEIGTIVFMSSDLCPGVSSEDLIYRNYETFGLASWAVKFQDSLIALDGFNKKDILKLSGGLQRTKKGVTKN